MITLRAELFQAFDRGGTVVVPTRQRAHAVRIAFAHRALAEGRTAWPSPDALPLDAWLMREIERDGDCGSPRVLSAAQEWWVWREAVAATTREAHGLMAPSLVDSLRRADRLAADHRIDVGRWLAVGGPETRLLHDVQRQVRQVYAGLGAAPASMLARERPGLGGDRPVHFIGFHAPDAPGVRALHASRRERGLPGEWWTPCAADATPRVELAGDEADEAGRMAAWCQHTLMSNADARLMIVAAGGEERREAIAAELRAALAPRAWLAGAVDADLVAIEGGAPLARQALVRHALSSLGWLIEGLGFEDFSDWLRSPYGALTRSAGAQLDLWWRRHAPLEADARASLARLTRAAGEGIGAAATLAAKARTALGAVDAAPATARAWSERFSAALDALQRDEPPAWSSVEQQARVRLVALLDEFGELSRVTGRLDARQALRTLRELAGRASWQAATGDALVTIAARYDDPVVRHDGIWVAGLTADAWPGPPLADPFLPLAALREAGVAATDTAGCLAAAEARIAAWRAATGDLVFSAATVEGDMKLAPSPLLAAFAEHSPTPRATWLALALRHASAPATAWHDDAAGNAWSAAQPLPGGVRSIELQAACPFRAHAELQLGAEPLDEPAPGVRADERGRWLHRALDLFWRGLGDSSRLALLSAAELDERAADAVARAMEAARDAPQPHVVAARRRESQRCARLIVALARLEQSRPPFAIEALEDERQVTLGAARLAVRIDRIDVLGGGGRAIIDYKSGQLPRLDWYGERPGAPQLLVYLAALGDDVRALAHAGIAPPAPRFQGAAAEGGLLPGVKGLGDVTRTAGLDWPERVGHWRSQVVSLAQEFLRGHATVTPAPGACRYCHLAALCRIGERARLEAGESADG